jgi:UDP-N-acetylglucosamine pyrophosphorylase
MACLYDWFAFASQVEHMRSTLGVDLSFMLMNSFATSKDTLDHLSKYEGLAKGGVPLEFCQNKVRQGPFQE